MLRSTGTVFLGVVVNPKSKAPVYVTRQAQKERTVDIWTVAESSLGKRDRFYVDIATGYLEEVDGDFEYRAPSLLTGYPRSHTPSALKKGTEHGAGFGTCLYTGLVLLATADHEGDLVVPNLLGSDAGICSDTESRSDEADRWWRRARQLGMVYQEKGDVESNDEATEEEVVEDEDLTDYMSRVATRRIYQEINDAVGDAGDWSLKRVASIRGDVYRDIPLGGSKYVVADIYTYEAARKAHLVAVRDVEEGTPIVWAKSGADAVDVDKDAILALNVANEDTIMAGKLARLAQGAGATEREVTHFMMRNRFGVDSWRSVPALYVGGEPIDRMKHHRSPPPTEDGEPPASQNPLPIFRRNPETPSAGERGTLERHMAELDRRRDDLGWNHLEALP